MKAKYMVKRRTSGLSKSGGWGNKLSYGPWIDKGRFDTLEEAQAKLDTITGLYDKAIFYRGERLTPIT